jgi:hypothetical protein
MSKKFKRIASIALPVIGTLAAPGIGTALGSSLSGAALSGIGGALGGAAGGALNGGGVSGALKGAAIGGLGGYLSGGGFSDLLSGTALGNGLNSVSNGLGFGDVVSPAADAARSTVSSAATAAAPAKATLSGYLPAGGAGATGGGTSGGFLSNLLGGNSGGVVAGTGAPVGQAITVSGGSSLPWLNEVAAGTLAPNVATGSLPWLSDVAAGTLAANPTVSGGSVLSRFLDNPIQSIASGAEDMLSPRNLIKNTLPYAFGSDNSRGFEQMQASARNAASAYRPFSQSGTAATMRLSDLYGLNGPEAATAAMADIEGTPGYQFARDQGIKALDASAASKGMLRSGNQEQAVQTFGTGLANQYYQQFLDNLARQQGVGLNATGGMTEAEMAAAEAFAAQKQRGADLRNQYIGLLSSYL